MWMIPTDQLFDAEVNEVQQFLGEIVGALLSAPLAGHQRLRHRARTRHSLRAECQAIEQERASRRERSNLNYDRDCRCGHNTWAHEPTASCRVCECPCFDDRIGAA